MNMNDDYKRGAMDAYADSAELIKAIIRDLPDEIKFLKSGLEMVASNLVARGEYFLSKGGTIQ